jgi:MFS family permease
MTSAGRRREIPSETTSLAATPLRRNRNFVLLWSSRAVSELGAQMALLVYPLLVLTVSGSAAYAGMAAFVSMAANAVAALPAGALVDRLPRRRILVASELGRGLAVGTLVMLVLSDAVHLWAVLVVAAVDGLLSAFFVPASQRTLVKVVSSEQLPAAVSHNQARTNAAHLAGPPLGGLLYGLSMVLPFAVNAVTYVASAVGLSFLRLEGDTARRPEHGGLWRAVGAGCRHVLRNRFLRVVVVCGAGMNIATNGLLLAVVFVVHARGNGPAIAGAVYGVAAGAAVVGSLLTPVLRRVLSDSTIILAVFWSTALATPLIALTGNLAVTGAVLVVDFLLFPAANNLLSARVLATTDEQMLGRVTSILVLAFGAGGALGPLTAGLLAERYSPATAIGGFSVLMALLAAIVTLSPSVRDSGTPPRHREAADVRPDR